MKNSCDCYHGARFSGILAECVHLIGFSRHSSAQQERKHRAGGKTSEERNGNYRAKCSSKDVLLSYLSFSGFPCSVSSNGEGLCFKENQVYALRWSSVSLHFIFRVCLREQVIESIKAAHRLFSFG